MAELPKNLQIFPAIIKRTKVFHVVLFYKKGAGDSTLRVCVCVIIS